MTPDVAVQVIREEFRASVKRHSGWYLGQTTCFSALRSSPKDLPTAVVAVASLQELRP
jgi:hypothetical protein